MRRSTTVAVAMAAALVFWSGAAGARNAPSSTTSYGADPLQTVTIYPAGPTLAVLVHGGGFRSSAGDARKMASQAHTLQSAGITVAVVNYRDDRAVGAFPFQVDDVVDGTRAALALTGSTRASLIGGSSGGSLVSDAAVEMGNQVSDVFVLSGTEDLAAALAYWRTVPGPTGKLHVTNLTTALLGVDPSTWSPVDLVGPSDVGQRWFVYNSATEEQPVAQADAITAALAAQDVPVVETILPGSNHAFDYWSQVEGKIAGAIG